MIQAAQLMKSYRMKDETVPILSIPYFVVEKGQRVAIIGPSGSGKSTLLHLIGGVMTADSGSLRVNGQELHNLREKDRDQFRAREIGYVFQDFHLIPSLTAEENVRLVLPKGEGRAQQAMIREWFDRVGLAKRLRHRPSELSRGEQQRVALIRALINRPALVLADEPTGSLDWETAQEMMQLLLTICQEERLTLLCVTHDLPLAERFPRVVHMGEINELMKREKGGVAV